MFLPFAFIVHCILLYSIVDIHFRGFYGSSFKLSPCKYNVTRSSKRIVLLLADGIETNEFFNVTNYYKGSYMFPLTEAIGSWGSSYGSQGFNFTNFDRALGTGTRYDGYQLWTVLPIGRPNIDNVFYRMNDIFYIGNRSKYRLEFENIYMYKMDGFNSHNLSTILTSNTNNTIFDDNVLIIIDLTTLRWPKAEKIQYIYKIITETDTEITKTFNDRMTSFIFTSFVNTDFGAPFAAWGAGISNNKKTSEGKDEMLVHNQTDLAVFIATLLGIPIPAQSVGTLKPDMLDMSDENKAAALLCNKEQIESLLNYESRDISEGKISIFPLTPPNHTDVSTLNVFLDKEINNRNFTEIIKISRHLLGIYLRNLGFYRNYFKYPLLTIIVSTYVVWLVFLMQRLLNRVVKQRIKQHPSDQETSSLGHKLSISSVWSKMTINRTFYKVNYTLLGFLWDSIAVLKICLVIALVCFQRWPLYFLIYFLLFDVITWKVCRGVSVFMLVAKEFVTYFQICKWFVLSTFVISLIVVGVIDNCFMIVGLAFIVIMPYLLFLFQKFPLYLHTAWISSSCGLVFMLVFEKTYNPGLVKLSIYIWAIVVSMYLYFKRDKLRDSSCTFVMLFAMIIYSNNKRFVPQYSDEFHVTFGWACICVAPFLPIFASQDNIFRLFHVTFSFAIPYFVLSTGIESISLLFLSIHVLSWYCIELSEAGCSLTESEETQEQTKPNINVHDIRRGIVFFFYMWCSFFITGNPDFTSTFQLGNTSMSSLKIYNQNCLYLVTAWLKLLIPYVIIYCSFRLMNRKLNRRTGAAIEWILLMNNIVCFFFFVDINPNGNYLDIRYSVLRYILAHCISIFIIILYPISSFLTKFSFDMKKLKTLVDKSILTIEIKSGKWK